MSRVAETNVYVIAVVLALFAFMITGAILDKEPPKNINSINLQRALDLSNCTIDALKVGRNADAACKDLPGDYVFKQSPPLPWLWALIPVVLILLVARLYVFMRRIEATPG